MNSKIFCVFAGLGKTYVGKKYDNIIDCDISAFKYKNFDAVKNYETLKATKNRVINEEYPKNYLDNLKNVIKQDKLILVPADLEIREFLIKEQINFTFILPSLDSEEELIRRYKQRGNNDLFISRAINDLRCWNEQIPLYNYETIVLPKNYNIEQYLKDIRLIK